MTGVLVTVVLPGEPRQQFDDPLAAVLCLLRALTPGQIHVLKLDGIRRVEQSRLSPPLGATGSIGTKAVHSKQEPTE